MCGKVHVIFLPSTSKLITSNLEGRNEDYLVQLSNRFSSWCEILPLGMASPVSEKEKEAFNEFYSHLEELSILQKLESTEEAFLLRWLRARDHNIKDSVEMIKDYLDWKETNEDYKLAFSSDWICSEEVVDEFKFKFTGYDYEGRPVVWMPLARYDLRGLFENGKKADCFRQCYRMLDMIVKEVENQTKKCGMTQFVAIVDSAELTFRKVSHFPTLQAFMRFFKEFDAYYPELLHSCFIVNAPWLFSTIFNIARTTLSAKTLKKISIYDSNEEYWKSDLIQKLPKCAVPEDYGGNAPPVLTVYTPS